MSLPNHALYSGLVKQLIILGSALRKAYDLRGINNIVLTIALDIQINLLAQMDLKFIQPRPKGQVLHIKRGKVTSLIQLYLGSHRRSENPPCDPINGRDHPWGYT